MKPVALKMANLYKSMLLTFDKSTALKRPCACVNRDETLLLEWTGEASEEASAAP